MRSAKARPGGLSLAETAIAGSLLCLLLITVLNLFPAALAAVSSARQINEANVLAQNALEVMAARPFDSLNLGTQPNLDLAVPSGYTLVVEVSPVDTYSTDFLKRVRVSVTWTFRNMDKKVEQELYVQPVH